MPVPALIGSLAGPLFGLVDDLFTSDEEREAAKLKLLEMEQKGELAPPWDGHAQRPSPMRSCCNPLRRSSRWYPAWTRRFWPRCLTSTSVQ